jgi:hypothetical protein
MSNAAQQEKVQLYSNRRRRDKQNALFRLLLRRHRRCRRYLIFIDLFDHSIQELELLHIMLNYTRKRKFLTLVFIFEMSAQPNTPQTKKKLCELISFLNEI